MLVASDLFVGSSDALVFTIKLTAKYSKPQLSGIQASIILLQLGKILKNFIKLLHNQSCNVHMFTHCSVVLVAATSSAASHSSLCLYGHSDS
jgi:hypothetical protein